MTTLPWSLQAHPRIRLAGHFPLRDQNFQTVYRGEFHALHVHDYAGTIVIGGERFALQAGSLTLSPAGLASSYDLPQPGHHWCIHFHPLTRVADLDLGVQLQLGTQRQALVERIRQVAALHARGGLPPPAGPLAAAAASAALQEILLRVALLQQDGAVAKQRVARSSQVIDSLVGLVQERLDQAWSVPDLAAELGLSQNHLARCFRERYGCTIQRFVLERRIEHARLLLATTTLQISEVGSQVGMPDPQHFNKQFRRICGISPSQARAQVQ